MPPTKHDKDDAPKSDAKSDTGSRPSTPTAPASSDAGGKPYEPTGKPLHGDPNPHPPTSDDKRDDRGLAKTALETTTGVTETRGVDSEFEKLLAESKAITAETGGLSRERIVTLRMNLQRFRGIDDAHAQAVDDEVNRLEALLLGFSVDKGEGITGQKRNMPEKQKARKGGKRRR